MTDFLNHSSQLFVKTFASFYPKLIIWLLSAPLFFFDSMKKDAMIGLLMLIIFDFMTAIIAAMKTGELIQSSKAKRTAIKALLYFTMVSGGHFVDMSLNGAIPFYVDSIIISFLAITELISIFENVKKYGYDVPTNLIQFLKDKIKKTEIKTK